MPKLAALPGTHPSVASNTSAGWDPSYIILVDTGTPRSLPRLPSIARGFWAVVLSCAVWKGSWAGRDPAQSKITVYRSVATTGKVAWA